MNLDNWFEDVPIGWNTEKIRNVAFYSPQSISLEQLKEKNFYYYDIPTVQAIGAGRVEEGNNIDSNKLILQGGELLISKLNPRKGTVVLTESNTLEMICSTEFIPLKVKEQVYDKFLYFIMGSEKVADYLNKFVKSATRSHQRVNPQDILNMRIPVPKKEEQYKIVSYLDIILDSVQNLISNKEKLMKILEQQRQSIITEAVSKGLNPNVKMKDSGVEWIGEIPEHWDKSKLKYLTRQIIDGTHHTPDYQEEGIPFLRVTDITKSKGKEINLSDVKYISQKEHSELIKRCRPENGDLLVSKNGTIGVPKVVDWDWDFSIFVSLCLIKLKKNKLNPGFASFYFESQLVDEQIAFGSKKSTIMNLHLDKVKEFFIFVPPLSEQNEIVKYLNVKVSEVDNLKIVVENQIQKLKEYRQALIYEAVTGKIDVRDLELD